MPSKTDHSLTHTADAFAHLFLFVLLPFFLHCPQWTQITADKTEGRGSTICVNTGQEYTATTAETTNRGHQLNCKVPFKLTPLSSASLESTKMVGQSRHNNCTASFRFTEIRSKYGRQRKEWGDRERTFFIVVLSIIADHYSERVTIREQ